MGLRLPTERYAPQIAGVLSCWDRILLFGMLPKICYAEGMTSYLYERKIRIFDYPKFAEPFRNTLRPRMRAAAHAVIALATSPKGFTASQLAQKVDTLSSRRPHYGPRHAEYDLKKLR